MKTRSEHADPLRASRWAAPRRRLLMSWLVFALAITASQNVTAQQADATEPAPLLLILDASGSMWGQVDGENKIVIARRVLGDLVDGLPATADLGLVAYGHRRKGDCADIETLIPLGPVDPAAVKSATGELNPTGKTPITAAVEHTLELIEAADEQATVILLSDGLETCGGDPCKAVRLAKEAGAPLLLHVIGFDVEGEDLAQLQCMAQAGGGLFLGAADAGELGAALETAVALPVDAPVGRLAVRAVANGELQDVSIRVMQREDGKEVATARTYRREDTNPSSIPLADGEYDVRVLAIGFKGAREHHFAIEIEDGNTVEKEIDFSTGELRLGVTRNGAPSDAVYKIYDAASGEELASGRTYTSAKSNPATVRLTAGRYDVKVSSVEIAGKVWNELGTVEIEPRGKHELAHAFTSGTLSVGAVRAGERVDAVVSVVDLATGKEVAKGRTYTAATSNPKTFVLRPGRYRVSGRTVGKDRAQKEVEVEIQATEDLTQDLTFE